MNENDFKRCEGCEWDDCAELGSCNHAAPAEDEWKPDYSVTPRRIVCAAIKHKVTGRIIAGARHYDKIMRAQIAASEGIKSWRGAAQGFIDQFGDFLERDEACVVAKAQRQRRHRCGGDEKTLYSENLY